MIEIITTKNEWNLLLDEVDDYDFYSTYDYHTISNTRGDRPVMIKYTQDDIVIGLPLLIRQIDGSPYYDATSVYGYAGPVSKNMTENFDNRLFKKELNELFIDHKIVSVFSRLNPYLPYQDTVLKTIGEIKIKGDVVMIDLSEPLEVQRQQYQKRLKSQVNRARKLCSLKKVDSKADIDVFIDLYYETMNRVEAKKSYFFSREYFYEFMNNDHSEIDIFLVSLNETGEVISGGMFIKTKDIIQYHLSGAKTEHLDVGALKLLIDEVRIRGTEAHFKMFNLGGGLSSKDDSLLRFKKSFSKSLRKFATWQCIVNESVYKELAETAGQHDPDYFPEYRCRG